MFNFFKKPEPKVNYGKIVAIVLGIIAGLAAIAFVIIKFGKKLCPCCCDECCCCDDECCCDDDECCCCDDECCCDEIDDTVEVVDSAEEIAATEGADA